MKRLMTRITWAIVGAALAYLFDPVSGQSRQARLQDQIAAVLRDIGEAAGKQVRYQAGKAKGAVYEATTSEEPPSSDDELRQKVKSEAVGMVPGATEHVEVHVEHGIVRLTGHSSPSEERELIERVSHVTGVREVKSDLANA